MAEERDPRPGAVDGRPYHHLLLQAVSLLTEAARLTWTVTGTDGQVVRGRADWAEFVALALRLGPSIVAALGLDPTKRSAFSVAFGLVGALALLAVIESVLLAPHAGAEVRVGQRRTSR